MLLRALLSLKQPGGAERHHSDLKTLFRGGIGFPARPASFCTQGVKRKNPGEVETLCSTEQRCVRRGETTHRFLLGVILPCGSWDGFRVTKCGLGVFVGVPLVLRNVGAFLWRHPRDTQSVWKTREEHGLFPLSFLAGCKKETWHAMCVSVQVGKRSTALLDLGICSH